MTVPTPTPRGLAAIATVTILAAATLAAAVPGRERPTPATPVLGRPIRASGPLAPTSPASAPPFTAMQVSEAFATGYAAFLRGRAPYAVPYSTGSLRARLAPLHPQLPAAAASASNPHVTSVRVTDAHDATATSTAVIEDGRAIDPLTMRLVRRAGAWIVVDLAETG